MREVFPNLYCGNDNDYSNLMKEHIPGREIDQPTDNWAVVHAAKEPCHRQFVGYTGRGCPKESIEYLWAERGNRLALNIVDAPKAEFFDKSMIDKALEFIGQKLDEGLKVLTHCNEGRSRSCALIILYVTKRVYKSTCSFEIAESEMKKIYPLMELGKGIREHLIQNWDKYNV